MTPAEYADSILGFSTALEVVNRPLRAPVVVARALANVGPELVDEFIRLRVELHGVLEGNRKWGQKLDRLIYLGGVIAAEARTWHGTDEAHEEFRTERLALRKVA